jgi:uncharacterized protein with HEPN domain
MNAKDRKNLELLLSHCLLMERHVEYFGDNKEEYMDNEHYQAACGFELLEIGEYINRLSDEFIEKHSDIDWSGFVGMRVIHAHHYEGIILDLVWDAIKVDVPELKKYVEKILNE